LKGANKTIGQGEVRTTQGDLTKELEMRRRGRPSDEQLEKLRRVYEEAEDRALPPMPDTFDARAGYERESLTNQILDAVQHFMNERGITQQHIAAEMGVSDARVSQILSGEQNLTLKTLASVAAALNGHFHVSFDARVNSSGDLVAPRPAEAAVRRVRRSV